MASSWPTLPDWSAGDVGSAADFDVLRDGVQWVGEDKPACRATRSTDLAIATSTDTAILMDGESFDNQGAHSTSGNTSRITIPSGMGGIYLVGGQAQFDSTSACQVQLTIRINAGFGFALEQCDAAASGRTTLSVAALYPFVSGDYVQLYAFHNKGSNLSVKADTNPPYIWATWVASL